MIAVSTMAIGSTMKPVGTSGVVIPSAWQPSISRKAMNPPIVIMSPWAKWAKRRMPKISVTPIAPTA